MKQTALSRYESLRSGRQQFLDAAREAAALTIPYLMTEEGFGEGEKLPIPWQSLGAKGCNVLSSKLMLSLFPLNTSFFKLSINEQELAALPEITPDIRSEVDLTLSKMERTIMQQISESSDRVILYSAMRHLVVTGNVLLFAGKKHLKLYPLNRFVVDRDGNGEILHIVTKEHIHRSLLPKEFQKLPDGVPNINSAGEDGVKHGVAGSDAEDATVFTHCELKDGSHKWYQECDGKILPNSQGSSPKNISPWICCRFNITDQESYGRSRVSEYQADLQSLDGLMQSMVEGSATMAKVVFAVSPSSVTKPQALARASTGSIISGRADDVSVIATNKQADFRTVREMIEILTQRISDAFLILSPRQSERTTATEISAVQQELNEQLSGVYGNLTVTLLTPYLNRKLHILQRNKSIPQLPKGLISPVVVAGLNSLGRQQDKVALMEFMNTVAQSLGAEALAQYIVPTEVLKRLAAASGIETLNLIKDQSTMDQEMAQMQQAQTQDTLMKQAGQLARSPIAEKLINGQQQQEPPALQEEGGVPLAEGGESPEQI